MTERPRFAVIAQPLDLGVAVTDGICLPIEMTSRPSDQETFSLPDLGVFKFVEN